MTPILLSWPMTSEVAVGGLSVDAQPSCNIPLNFVAVPQRGGLTQWCLTWQCI